MERTPLGMILGDEEASKELHRFLLGDLESKSDAVIPAQVDKVLKNPAPASSIKAEKETRLFEVKLINLNIAPKIEIGGGAHGK